MAESCAQTDPVVTNVDRVSRAAERPMGAAADGGVDLVFDAVGGRGLRRGFESLRPRGRLVAYGFAEMMPRGGRRNWAQLGWRRLRMPRFNPLGMTARNVPSQAST